MTVIVMKVLRPSQYNFGVLVNWNITMMKVMMEGSRNILSINIEKSRPTLFIRLEECATERRNNTVDFMVC